MKLDLTHDELRRLVELTYLAQWLMQAFEGEEGAEVSPYEAVAQKVYARAMEAGMGDLVEYEGTLREYSAAPEMEDAVQPYIEAYDAGLFWDELIHRLAMRDAAQRVGGSMQLLDLPLAEKLDLTGEFEDFWSREFERHGLERIRLSRNGKR